MRSTAPDESVHGPSGLQLLTDIYRQRRDREISDAPVLITIPEAARRLSIGRSTAYELIAAGRLEVVHVGRSARVPVDALDNLVEDLRARRRPTSVTIQP